MSSAYQPAAANGPAAAASKAEELKHDRYPAKNGRSVTPFGIETWGRLGPSAESLLQELAGEAAKHARLRGHAATSSSFLRRWRATLDACVQKSIVRSLLASRYGLPGRAHGS